MTQVMFQSAYKQLTSTQRVFVDNLVHHIEQTANRTGERITIVLYQRPIPDQFAHALLENRLVQAAITERVHEIAAERELTEARWLKHAQSIAFSNMADFMRDDGDGMVFDLTMPTREQWAAVKSVEIEDGGDDGFTRKKRKIKLTLWDKPAGMKMLGQYMGMLEAENPHWKADMARVRSAAAPLPAGATAEDAGAEYQKYLGT